MKKLTKKLVKESLITKRLYENDYDDQYTINEKVFEAVSDLIENDIGLIEQKLNRKIENILLDISKESGKNPDDIRISLINEIREISEHARLEDVDISYHFIINYFM